MVRVITWRYSCRRIEQVSDLLATQHIIDYLAI
jgi:hypothetical protein